MSLWNTANLAHACRACVAALIGSALVMLSTSLAEAEYGPRTTLGNNYQQTSSETSVNGIDPANCTSNLSCYVLFQKAPQQRPLIVQHVSCIVFVSTGELRYGILVTRKGQTFPLRHTHLVPVPTSGSYSVVNTPVMHLLKPGERAAIRFFNSASANWGTPPCTISGKLLQP